MHGKYVPIMMLVFLFLMIAPSVAQAAIITACTLDRDMYYQGETGQITVAVYNNKEDKIRVTEVTASIEYYYADDTLYVQTFYSGDDLPAEIEPGNSGSFLVSFSLPTNIGSGYTEFHVKAKTELWIAQSDRWFPSDHSTSEVVIFIESPYKPWYEDQLEANDDLQEQLDEQLAINDNTTNMMYLFGGTTLVFAAVAGFLYYILNRRTRFLRQPIA